MGGKAVLGLTSRVSPGCCGRQGGDLGWEMFAQHWGHLSPGQDHQSDCKTNEEISVTSKTATYQL